MPFTAPHNTVMSIPATAHPIATEASGSTTGNSHQNAEAINANGWENSTSVGTHNGWGADECTKASHNGWMDKPAKEDYNGWGAANSGPTSEQSQAVQTHTNPPPVVQPSSAISASVSTAPSAPPIPEQESGKCPIHYPSVENNLVDLHVPVVEYGSSASTYVKDEGNSSLCIICWEAPIEGACIPCGHMAGCMSCLNDIKARKGPCPVCRSDINQVIRLYAV